MVWRHTIKRLSAGTSRSPRCFVPFLCSPAPGEQNTHTACTQNRGISPPETFKNCQRNLKIKYGKVQDGSNNFIRHSAVICPLVHWVPVSRQKLSEDPAPRLPAPSSYRGPGAASHKPQVMLKCWAKHSWSWEEIWEVSTIYKVKSTFNIQYTYMYIICNVITMTCTVGIKNPEIS